MEAVVDTSCLHVSQAGIPRYTRGLLRGLAEACPAGSELRTIEFDLDSLDYEQPKRSIITALREGVWGPCVAPWDLMTLGADLLHSPDLPIIRSHRTPHVVTLHDLAVLETPQRYRRWQRWSGSRRLANLHRHDKIICISSFTAHQAMQRLGLPASQIEVIHNGCDFVDCPKLSTKQPTSFSVPSTYFLFVGSLEPGKNLQLLIEVWRLARKQGVDLPPLLIVGARREGVAMEQSPPEDWKYLGHIPDTELAYLYQHARGLLFPSTYEGWGLPIVEAMALDCPVVASPLTAIPEAAGDAALLIDQTPEAWLEAAQSLLDTGVRASLKEQSRRHVAQFSWQRMGAELWETYDSVIRERCRGSNAA